MKLRSKCIKYISELTKRRDTKICLLKPYIEQKTKKKQK